MSSWQTVLGGVPQGSVFDPVLQGQTVLCCNVENDMSSLNSRSVAAVFGGRLKSKVTKDVKKRRYQSRSQTAQHIIYFHVKMFMQKQQ